MYRKSENAKYKEQLNKLLNNGMQFVMLCPNRNIVKPYRLNYVEVRKLRLAQSIVSIDSPL